MMSGDIYHEDILDTIDPNNTTDLIDEICSQMDDTSNYKFLGDLCDLESADSVKNGIIKVCTELSNMCHEVLVSIVLSDKDSNLITFIKKSIEYFISYTSEIYKFSYKNSFNSYSEGTYISDCWSSRVNYTDVDSFYYDEELTISITNE